MEKLPQDAAEELPTYEPHLKVAVALDAGFWADKIQQLTERFNQFAAQ